MVFPETPTRANSMSLAIVVVICVKVTVAVRALYFPLLPSMGLAVSAPTKPAIPPVAGWLVPNVQV